MQPLNAMLCNRFNAALVSFGSFSKAGLFVQTYCKNKNILKSFFYFVLSLDYEVILWIRLL